MLNTFPVRFQQPVNTCLAFGWTSFSLLFKWFCVTFIQDICFSLALTGCNYLSYMCTIRLKCEASKTRRPVQMNRFINGKAGTYFFKTSRNSTRINSYENNTDEIMQGDLAYGKWLICFSMLFYITSFIRDSLLMRTYVHHSIYLQRELVLLTVRVQAIMREKLETLISVMN